jgi:hypothetical protein
MRPPCYRGSRNGHSVCSCHPAHFPASRISLNVAGTTINRKLARSIRDLVSRTKQLASFSRRYGWTASQFDSLDWPLFRSSVSSFGLSKRFCMLKWLNDLLPVQARMHRYGQATLAGCPRSVDAPPKTSSTSYTALLSIAKPCLIPCTRISRLSLPVIKSIPTSVASCSPWWTHAGGRTKCRHSPACVPRATPLPTPIAP